MTIMKDEAGGQADRQGKEGTGGGSLLECGGGGVWFSLSCMMCAFSRIPGHRKGLFLLHKKMDYRERQRSTALTSMPRRVCIRHRLGGKEQEQIRSYRQAGEKGKGYIPVSIYHKLRRGWPQLNAPSGLYMYIELTLQMRPHIPFSH